MPQKIIFAEQDTSTSPTRVTSAIPSTSGAEIMPDWIMEVTVPLEKYKSGRMAATTPLISRNTQIRMNSQQ